MQDPFEIQTRPKPRGGQVNRAFQCGDKAFQPFYVRTHFLDWFYECNVGCTFDF